MLAAIGGGQHPTGVAVRRDGERAYAANFDANTNVVTRHHPVEDKAVGVVVSPRGTEGLGGQLGRHQRRR